MINTSILNFFLNLINNISTIEDPIWINYIFCSPDTETGEILMSGRHVMMGYMGNEEKTAETVVDSKEGWLR